MNIDWYPGKHPRVIAQQALEKTAAAVQTDLYQSQTIPRDTGELQENTTVDYSQAKYGRVSLISARPYARRLYYHPEYTFRKDKNRNARGMWFQPYLEGKGRTWVKQVYRNFLKQAYR